MRGSCHDDESITTPGAEARSRCQHCGAAITATIVGEMMFDWYHEATGKEAC